MLKKSKVKLPQVPSCRQGAPLSISLLPRFARMSAVGAHAGVSCSEGKMSCQEKQHIGKPVFYEPVPLSVRMYF